MNLNYFRIMNIYYCRTHRRYIFNKRIDNICYKKIFRTKAEAERYRDFFYMSYYNK